MPFKDEAKRKEYHREYYHLNLKEVSKGYHRRRRLNDPIGHILMGARSRAKRKGIEFSLNRDDIILPEFCPALGLKLKFNEGGFKDNSPSLDRIDNSKGYIKGNVQVLSYKANAMKSSGTFEDIEKLYFYMRSLNDPIPRT